MPRNLLLISSSRVFGFGFLENVADSLRIFLKRFNVNKVLFIPYANTNYEEYLNTVKEAFIKLKLPENVQGIHESPDPISAVNSAQAIFIGGGNTFLLLKTLYDLQLIEPIRKRILQDSVPYIGSSAGTNVATVSINTTNDMPIVFPPTFAALGLVPFNINPHYLDATLNSPHQGETRHERISQYLEMSDCHPVLGLREGSSILVEDFKATLIGEKTAVLFTKDSEVEEIPAGSDISYLLKV